MTTLSILYVPRPSRLTAHVRSRLRSLDIEQNTVSAILRDEYGLTVTASPDNLPNTRRNHNLIVHTTAGKKVFKLYRRDWRPATIDFEHSILRRLAELDVPAPRLAATRDGRTWVSHGDDRYALFDFIDGTNYSSSFLLRAHRLRLTSLSGAILAGLHRELQGFLPDGRHHLGFAAYEGPRHRDLAWHAARIAELKAQSADLRDPEAQRHADWLIERGEYMVEEMGRLDEALDGAGLPRLIIHGDYGMHNLVIRKLGQGTPVDFELARLEWRLSDLASCLSKLRYGDGPYDFESMRWFMRAYCQHYPISRDEWRWFPDVLRYYRLMGSVQYWNSYFETNGPTRKLLSARDAFEQANWGWDHQREVNELGNF